MYNIKRILPILMLISIVFVFSSCDEELDNKESLDSYNKSSNPYDKLGKLGDNPEEIMRNAILEFTDMLKLLDNTDDAYIEMFYLFQNNYYVDSYIALEDLLNPSSSEIYNKVDDSKFTKGSFKIFFNNSIDSDPDSYQNLNYVVNNRNIPSSELSDEEKMEQFYEVADITLYSPYIVNESTSSLFVESDDFTLVPGVIDADSGLGYSYNSSSVKWSEIQADDDYSANNFSIIIEPNHHCADSAIPVLAEFDAEPTPCTMNSGGFSGGEIEDGNSGADPGNNQYSGDCDQIKEGDYVRQVFIGSIKCTKQYDKYISFTGNGGGSELQFTRTDSKDYLEGLPNDSDITRHSFTDEFQVHVTRHAIRKKRERWYAVPWDFNWECAEPKYEQLLMIYEKDNTSPIDFDFSGIEWEGETYGAVSLEYQVRTKNEIIRTWKRDAAEFFVTNMLSDYGCGCKYGQNSFSDRCWPRYDCGANVIYTMPHRWVPTN
ncbi:MAG: hypothetical protein ACQESK_01315 [Bacteroidota bacterium]